ncbi:MAG: hypothetical protein HGA80_06370 [Candidatus Omnitrophica bacterium]|nr:hypothetical protein [Candidatus Omnitrophota bacterium]
MTVTTELISTENCLLELNQSPGVSKESTRTWELIRKICAHSHETVTEQNRPRVRFYMLAQTWKKDTEYMSSISDIVLHPAYQQIIGMGKEALPFIFSELKSDPHHWFWALKAITGIDAVAVKDRGNVPRMIDSWLDWGRVHGF